MELYCREAGTGQPMVLLHGNGEDSSYFKAQIAFFSKTYRVLAVDTRGHGQSPRGTGTFTLEQFADDLKELLEQKNLKKVILLGFSDGGNIAMIFALKYPQYVSRLILNGANLNPFGVKFSVQLPVVAEYAAALFCGLGKRLSGGKSEKMSESGYPGSFRQKRELLGLMVKEPWIRPELLRRIQVPALVIAGTKDMIRDSHTRKIAAFLPNGQLKLIEGSHFIAAEEPEEFNRVVEEFLWNSREELSEVKKLSEAEKEVGRTQESGDGKTEEEIMQRLWSGRKPKQIGWEEMRHSAVLVPLIRKDGELHVLFEVRAASLHSQPGEVCFPGGAVEKGETKKAAAVRETMEELRIGRENVGLLAPLDVLVTPGNVMVWPFLGLLKEYQGTFSKEEVDRIFTVPLSYFLEHEPERYQTSTITVPEENFPYDLIPDGRGYHWRKGHYDVLFYRNENAVIWGMTAKILYSFVRMYRAEMPR